MDSLGNLAQLRLTAGQRHDMTQSTVLLEGFEFDRVIVDRVYVAETFLVYL